MTFHPQESLGNPVVTTHALVPLAQVQSLVEELRSCKPHVMTKKNKILKGTENTLSSFVHPSTVWKSDIKAPSTVRTEKNHTLGAARFTLLEGALDHTLQDDFCIKEK